MAGDWIKMRAGLTESPSFMAICERLELSRGDCLLSLMQLASWFATYSEFGFMPDEDIELCDLTLSKPGLVPELRRVGWIKSIDGFGSLTYFCAPMAARKSLGRKVREEVLQSGPCAGCGTPNELEIDHDIPVCRGGSSDRSNLQPMCSTCNRRKGRRTTAEFRLATGAEG